MLRPRLIPSLLIHDGALVKTRRFGEPRYVGDALNAVRIFNEKEVDELAVFDIDATRRGRSPDFSRIAALAAECRMPLTYGGGVRSGEDAQRIVQAGAEKVAVSSALLTNHSLAKEVAALIGSQSVVAVIDARFDPDRKQYLAFTHNGTKNTGLEVSQLAQSLEDNGVGEIVLNSIDRDGTGEGYDLELIAAVRQRITLPLTILGGVGSLDHVQDAVRAFGLLGAAAGSLFVFKGKHRAVLINYPRPEDKRRLLSDARTGFRP